MVLGIVEKTVKAATPHFLGIEVLDGFPEPDYGSSAEYLQTFFEVGIRDIKIVLSFVLILLNVFSLALKRHTFPNLEYDAQSDLMERLFSSNNRWLNGMYQVMSTPIMMAYYCRPDVQKACGFDILALKEESNLRHVTRDGAPLPPKEGGLCGPGSEEEAGAEG